MKLNAVLWTALLSLVLCFGACSSDDEDNPGTDAGPVDDSTVPEGDAPPPPPPGAEIVIGATLWDDISDNAKLRLQAAELAAEQITASGVMKLTIKNLSPAVGDAASGDKAGENAVKLFDDDPPAVAVVSMGSGIAKGILAKIGEGKYAKYPQCSNAASSPTLNANGDGTESTEFDKNDNFYRTVVHDFFQAALLAHIATVENSWDKVAVYSLDDAYGSGMRDALKAKLGAKVVWEQVHPTGDFDATAEKTNLDELIAKSGDGSISVVVLTTQKAQAPGIIKALTEGGYVGPILLPDGGRTDDVFTIAKDLKTWLDADAKNTIIGTESDNFAGKNSDQFTTDFKAKFSADPDAFSPTSYDCVFAFALGLLYAGDENYTAAGVWEGLQNFKEKNHSDDEVEVGIGADGFKAAADAIADGKKVHLEGAAGPLNWDDTGDLKSNPFRTFGPNDAADAYEVKKAYAVGSFE